MLKLRMSGAITLLLLYAFMAWTGTNFLLSQLIKWTLFRYLWHLPQIYASFSKEHQVTSAINSIFEFHGISHNDIFRKYGK
jgi:hypothetical protein